MNESTTTLVKSSGCMQTSTCSFVDITSPAPVICINQTLTVVTHKDVACGSTVSLQYNTDGVEDAIKINDSTYNFKFNKAWSGQIVASMAGCSLLMDSILVEVLDSKGPADLGADRNLCAGNTITLNAGRGYRSYQWQDGSTDSLFNVTQPGQYSVSVTDACSNVSSDMITVSAAPAVSISAGPDRTICMNDSIHLNAPSGFTNYTWTEAGLALASSQQLIVTPLANTQYHLAAEQIPGCFGYDTITVTVNQSAIISLGTDTTICNGQAVIIDAGSGFASYSWNNGSTTQNLQVTNGGEYVVRAATANGCFSRDTIRISVRDLPPVNLAKFTTICEGQTRVLNAGNFASYLWHDNSTSQTFTVSDPGTYYVTVLDDYGCEGSDTMTLASKVSSPKNFLPADTTFCSYGGVTLSSLQSMQSYSWSNGAQVPSITVNSAGNYWLQVTDTNGCSGYDTINVKLKECLAGLFVPNAFSPNNDGKNDMFKALLYGEVESFELVIFNRWGQRIFSSTDRFKGWNGMNGAKPADTGLYIWTCTYKLSGQEMKSDKGHINLVR
ncbi:MAG: gliding motility-associated C-terminal domain-containing protein [Pedobacter sp.]|nr:MAG: gliding motility-associated C-terminal domain-containing protein [Pedobacter sp.]